MKKAPMKGAFENRQKKEEIDLGRRKLLKIGAAIFAANGALLYVSQQKERVENTVGFFRKLLKYYQARVEKISAQKTSDIVEKEKHIDYIEINASGNSEKEVPEEDAVTVRDLVNFDSHNPIKLGPLEIERIQKNWEKRYYEGDKKRDLDEALFNMKNWEGPAKEVFMAEGEAYCRREKISGVEKTKFLIEFGNYFYLSIPESYWRLTDRSCANAAGPFQFMEKTAREYGLKLDEGEEKNFDERRDPEKSANAAARFLLRLYNKMDHNWDLALSNYNGGFAGKFKEEKFSDQKLNYPNFLEYLRRKIEGLKKELSSAITLTHEVIKNKESLETIAKQYGLEEKTLASMNKLAVGDKIKVGDKIIIPPTQENRRKNFYYHVDGFSQNINYPAKLYAVLAVIKKREKETGKSLLNQEPKLPRPWKEVAVVQEKPFIKYTTKKGDVLSGLVKMYGSDVATQIRQKKGFNKKGELMPKVELIVRNPKPQLTLATLAPAGTLNVLRKLNPAIIDPEKPLPDGIMIRSHVDLKKSALPGK
ncbi:MAG: transglycosylase SLT domain-containing protein [Parcubacteria group bacterium]